MGMWSVDLAKLHVVVVGCALLLAQSRRDALAQLRTGAVSSRPPGHPPAHRCAFGQLGLDARTPTPYRLHLSLSLSPSLASIPSGAVKTRFLDVADIMVKLVTLQRAATT